MMSKAEPAGLTRQQQLLLRATFADGRKAVEAWPAWRDSVDWKGHLDHDSFRLLPQLARNLRRLGVDDPMLPRFEGVGRQSWYVNQRRVSELVPALRALSDSGTMPLLLPPWSLLALQGTTVLSPQTRFSCAVGQDLLDRAVAGLAGAGWRPVRLPEWAVTGYCLWTGRLALEKDGGRPIQLHRQEGHLDAGVWQRARTVRLSTIEVLLPEPADMIHDLCCRPSATTFFSRVVCILLHGYAENDPPDMTGIFRRLEKFPVDTLWLRALECAGEFWPGERPREVEARWDSLPSPSAMGPTPQTGGFVGLMVTYWGQYRDAWGEGYSLPRALCHLPGYLMGRWGISPMALPKTLVQALSGEWRRSRRGG